jgi:hypothetical protein
MSHHSSFFSGLSKGGSALGKGIIAGFAGTIAITISQMIEMKITGRSGSNATVKVGGKALGVEPRGKAALEKEKEKSDDGKAPDELQQEVEANKQKFSQLMHFSYGTGWGVMRAGLDLVGVQGMPASLIHFGGIWATAQVMLPAAGASKPITDWSTKQIAVDVLHHAVYALAAGAVYDAMLRAEE